MASALARTWKSVLPDWSEFSRTSVGPALAGGVLWSLARIFTLAFAPGVRPTRENLYRGLAESLFAIIAALIAGLYVAPALIRYWHIQSIEMMSLVSLIVGLAFWQAVPVIIGLVLRVLPNAFSQYLGVTTNTQAQQPVTPPPEQQDS